MHRSISTLVAIAAITLGAATTASAQTPDISVDPQTPAPGAPVTVTGAPPGEPVIVRLGVQEESTTVDSSGPATVTIAAPDQPGEAVGTINVGLVDYKITVTVQATTATTTATTTTVPPPTTPPPVTGLDDTASLAGLAAAFLAAGPGFVALARRPSAVVTRGNVTHYRIVDRRPGKGVRTRRR
jgi:hypothetical protein